MSPSCKALIEGDGFAQLLVAATFVFSACAIYMLWELGRAPRWATTLGQRVAIMVIGYATYAVIWINLIEGALAALCG